MLVRRLARGWRWIGQNPVSHWCVLFVVLAATVSMHNNNVNPFSRYALLSAIAEDHSLAIDKYRADTCDWARTPDRHYFSNKAPGAALLALPLYLPLDAAVTGDDSSRKLRDARRLQARAAILDTLAVALQAIPFAVLVMFAANLLAARGVSRPALELAAIAMLFGNTASLLMNMFYGHGLAAVLTLGMALALCTKRMFWAGVLFGLNVLTDYGSALFFPVLVALVLWPGSSDGSTRVARLIRVALGGLGPLLVFAGYHALCFGGPFTLPNKYQNPVFVQAGARALWGVIDFLPNPKFMAALLFGSKRSLLVTQPWVLLVVLIIPCVVWQRRRGKAEPLAADRIVLPLAWWGLAALFLMNASFGGWHGGVCPGPRYLSAILPLVGLALGLVYDGLPKPLRAALWLAVLPSVLLFAMIWAGDIGFWPYQAIWAHAYEALFELSPPVSACLRLSWIVFAFIVTTWVALLRARWARAYKFS